MTETTSELYVKFAQTAEELHAAQRLRYDVFVSELGANGSMVDHDKRVETDRFDIFADHLLLIDPSRQNRVVGVYRLLNRNQAEKAGQFYSEDEYDLEVLKSSNLNLLELGRSCLAPQYRGGEGMFRLWSALAKHVLDNDIDVLFGTASFHGTDVEALKKPLSLLYHRHLAPEFLRVRTQAQHYQSLNLCAEETINRRETMLQIPALIKAYLRLGGFVGDGAFVDRQFNTVDVCLLINVNAIPESQKSMYAKAL